VRSLIENQWFIGIASGLAVAGVLGFLTSVVAPGFTKLFLSRSLDLSGTWDVYDSPYATGDPVGTWTIRQWGNLVHANITRHTSRHGNQMRRQFAFRGRVRSDQLCGVFVDRTGRHRSGAIVLRWMGSGNDMAVLSGKTVYWDRTPDRHEHRQHGPSAVVALAYSIRKRRRDR
jgi:hypothetical protein